MRRLGLLFVCAALFAVGWAQTGNDALMRFAGNIHQFNAIFPQEKVYLQFDNTSYYTGETIWFKAFVTRASDLMRAPSKVLYVDLISPAGEVLKQQKLMIVAGQADGSLTLLDGSTAQARDKRGILEYPSGFYEVRAYTSNMLNFDESIVFSRVFAVFEKPKKEGDYYNSSPVVKIRKTDDMDPRPKIEKINNVNVSFYPEGGHLIIGKPCRVAFKVTDETGFGIDAQGNLEDGAISFSTFHNGMGEFTFTPKEKRNQVNITVDGKSKTFNLPQAESSGIVLKTELSEMDDIRVTVDATDEFTGTMLGLTITCRGELMDFVTIETGSGPTEKELSLTGVPEGVCRIHLFDSEGTLYASRSFYHHNQLMKSPVLDVTPDKSSYGPFDKVSLSFRLADGNGNPFRDRFCLSVRDVRSQGNPFVDDLRTSMLLSSDLRGMIESPSWYFDKDDAEHDYALDLLCMIQGWERYDWQTMTGQKVFTEKHRIEESLTVNGWVMNSSGKKPMNNVEVNASLVPQDKKLTELYSYKTDSTGYWGFDLGVDFYDKAQFTIGASTGKKKRIIGPDARIVFERSIQPSIRAFQPEELVEKSNQIKKKRVEDSHTAPDEDDGLPAVISKEKGFILPEVEIEEERMYIDYFTFKAYDVIYDTEQELDKGDYSTDLYGYLREKGYEIADTCFGDFNADSVIINGFKAFFYIHDAKTYYDKGIADYPFSIDAQDIRSIIVYDRPMLMSEIIQVCPLFDEFLSKGMLTMLGSENTGYRDMLMDDMPNEFVNNDIFPGYIINSARRDPRKLERRRILIDIQLKEKREMSTHSDLFRLDRRVTTVDGFSRPYSFYSPEYPDGPIPGDVDYRRTLYWNPNVITDENGQVVVEFYNNSSSTRFNVSGAGITASGMPYVLDKDF
ncbi:MAG: hypothetical protein MJY68_07085 [Bacteroidaceae bacterium]|nr:hypothetical protein [Bacteroidaceae bacterium]